MCFFSAGNDTNGFSVLGMKSHRAKEPRRRKSIVQKRATNRDCASASSQTGKLHRDRLQLTTLRLGYMECCLQTRRLLLKATKRIQWLKSRVLLHWWLDFVTQQKQNRVLFAEITENAQQSRIRRALVQWITIHRSDSDRLRLVHRWKSSLKVNRRPSQRARFIDLLVSVSHRPK